MAAPTRRNSPKLRAPGPEPEEEKQDHPDEEKREQHDQAGVRAHPQSVCWPASFEVADDDDAEELPSPRMVPLSDISMAASAGASRSAVMPDHQSRTKDGDRCRSS